MFTIACQNCNNPVQVGKIPASATINCPVCSKPNRLEKEDYYSPRLIMIQGEEKGQEFVVQDVTTLGRGTYNTIQLKERRASRQHAVIKYNNNVFLIEDLKSGNGTFVNGKPVTELSLQDKDIIRIADAVFMFRNPYNYCPETVSAKMPGDSADVTIESKPPAEVEPEAVLTEKKSNFEHTRAELKFDAQHSFLMAADQLKNIADVEKANAKLRILYEVNHAISSILDLQALLKKILDVVFQYIPAERGAILLYNEDTKTLESAVTNLRDKGDKENFHISKTMMDRVIAERVSLLTTDALVDERLSEAMSIVTQGIRSAMSVPLISKESLLGVLHIDSTKKSTQFNQDTLELLTGIASQAAIAIENARLLQKIEKEIQTRGHLQRYLSPELVEQVVNQQIALNIGGQLRKATVIFSDLRGFTKMTEHLGAEGVVAILNDYFTRMVDIIFSNHGTLDKFIGDAIMAIWGIPIGNPKDTIRSVKAALQMQKELFYFNLFQKKVGRNKLKMGIGINVGEVVVGNMGSPKRMEYTVIGPPVNLASRVESLTKKNQVLVSDNTYHEIKNMLMAIEMGPAHVKGIERSVQIYAVVGIWDDEDKMPVVFLPVLVYTPKKTKTIIVPDHDRQTEMYEKKDYLFKSDIPTKNLDIQPRPISELKEAKAALEAKENKEAKAALEAKENKEAKAALEAKEAKPAELKEAKVKSAFEDKEAKASFEPKAKASTNGKADQPQTPAIPENEYEGLIQSLDAQKVVFDMEPNEDVQIGQEFSFIIDLPDIVAAERVRFVCQKRSFALHGQDEFLKVEGDVLSMPTSVKYFLDQIFPTENVEVTVLKKSTVPTDSKMGH